MKSKKICFHCNEEILKGQSKYMLGIDIPYINLFFHKECFNASNPDVQKYLEDNLEKLMSKINTKSSNVIK